MAKTIIFSRNFPSYHRHAGDKTYFVESVLKGLNIPIDEAYHEFLFRENIDKFSIEQINEFYESLYKNFEHTRTKVHTIRPTTRFKVGEPASFRVWSGKPYHTPQMTFAYATINQIIPVELHTGVEAVKINDGAYDFENYEKVITKMSSNDGLGPLDFISWFDGKKQKGLFSFVGKIIVFAEEPVEYP